MTKSKISNTTLRIISALTMLTLLGCVVVLQLRFPSLHIVRWVGFAIVLAAIAEAIKCFVVAGEKVLRKKLPYFITFWILLLLMLISVYFVGTRPWIMLWLLLIIVGADVGGWFFGLIFGGDKMWERISAHKTWAGQIGGIICGTIMSVLFCMCLRPFGNDALFAVLFGFTIALLSQYGDLTASYIKRCLGIKDFGNLLPGHGGILDRFDGWIYVLPFMWFFI